MKKSILFLSVTCLSLGSCTSMQSALDVHGPQAHALADLIWLITGVTTIVWLLVMLVLVLALARVRRPGGEKTEQKRLTITVTAAALATALVIAGLTIASFRTTRAIGEPKGDAVTVTVRGVQWWWQFLYEGEPGFETANEMHIPVGRDVRLRLESPDVIHSFWVPSLAGKLDLIPGRPATLTLHADRPGIYRGQCAEFCGLQHGHMAFHVIAESGADFTRWREAQARDAAEPANPEAARGRAVFEGKPCAACHTVRGTAARGHTGPDLTHIGSRRFLAAGMIENTRGTLAAWVADPQTMKPGNNMPIVPLTSDELRQVSAYLESLR